MTGGIDHGHFMRSLPGIMITVLHTDAQASVLLSKLLEPGIYASICMNLA